MVAFNMQKGYGKYIWITQGMFWGNGGRGYIRKPDLLMNLADIFDLRKTLPHKTILKVTCIRVKGRHLDFGNTHLNKLSPLPRFLREGRLTSPSVDALLIIISYASMGKVVMQTCLPVAELREGIRAVPLHSRKREGYQSGKLFMRFWFHTP
ncbi:hypothetical protein MLD38_025183 [Melastoma candidum]|uniref:Uncharacterized protein n=1 Tax=Melastoma candidum TaxID=119954 RepID=A0ACB9NU93_9MYRT|nr:hypothetical protein MLD38_025183 [Melastoma candidum]